VRLLSTIYLCVLVNVCKQTTPEITGVACTRGTVMSYLHETPLAWVIGLGREISLLPL